MICIGYNCDKCKHQTEMAGYRPACKAFPQGIPSEVLNRPLNSTEECANGYRYEPDAEKAAFFYKVWRVVIFYGCY